MRKINWPWYFYDNDTLLIAAEILKLLWVFLDFGEILSRDNKVIFIIEIVSTLPPYLFLRTERRYC